MVTKYWEKLVEPLRYSDNTKVLSSVTTFQADSRYTWTEVLKANLFY